MEKGGRGFLAVSDVVKSALATYVGCHEDPTMIKVKEYLMGEDTSITKAVVVAQHTEQWYIQQSFTWPMGTVST